MKYTCPVCGYKTFGEQPGSYEICRICSWEDDLYQLRFATTGGGANYDSLVDAQMSFQNFQTADGGTFNPAYEKDAMWRPIDLAIDTFENPEQGRDHGRTYPNDPTELYYWRK